MCFNEVRPMVLWYSSDQTKSYIWDCLVAITMAKCMCYFLPLFTNSHLAALFRVITQEALETVTDNLSTSQLDCCNMQCVASYEDHPEASVCPVFNDMGSDGCALACSSLPTSYFGCHFVLGCKLLVCCL